jgi:2-iminobutanoate/2-iminopropanoate deaminase
MKIGMRVITASVILAGLIAPAIGAEYAEKNDFQKKFAFSPAVVTEGGRIVWLAGVTTTRDEAGNDISGKFEPQARAIFNQMDKTLKQAGGSLANLVTMTIFVDDPNNVGEWVNIRRETFKDGNFPASTLLTRSNFALPGIVIEVQGVAVIGDWCSKANPCLPQ